ncbi:MAG: hypothetical protein R6V35_03895 [Candidatus Nanohaloarchaea archaeon]
MDVVQDSLLKASAFTFILVVLGILVGLQMDDMRQDRLTEELDRSNLETETFSVLDAYISGSDGDHCQLMDVQIPKIGERNAQLGSELQRFEAQNLGSDEEYRFIRDRYYNNQLRLYMAMSNYRDRCGDTNQTTVLYFFDDSAESSRMGSVLNEIVLQTETQVFSFNTEVDSPIVDILERDHNVTQSPTIVVNDEKKIEGFISVGELRYDVIEGNSTEQ